MKATKTTTAKTNSSKKATNVEVIELTKKESVLLNSLISILYAEAGFTDVDCNDLAKTSEMSVNSVKGIVSSLTKKGLVYTYQTETFGSPSFELVCLTKKAWCLHPEWKKQATETIEVKVNDDEVVKKSTATSKTKKSTVKKVVENKPTETKKVTGNVKPYGVYGIHGKNVELKGYNKGDKVEFEIKGKKVTGEYIHFHINNWSKNGYCVIKHEGKIYERVAEKVSKVEVKETAPKTTAKKTTKKAVKSTKK